MRYEVQVQGRSFVVLVEDGPGGTVASVSPGGTGAPLAFAVLTPAALAPGLGPLGVLVRPGSRSGVAWERDLDEGSYRVHLAGSRPLTCQVEDERARLARRARVAGGGPSCPKTVRSVMPGIVLKVLVEPGATVAAKDALLVVEAMKMQNEIRAEGPGRVSKVYVRAGQAVASGAPLVELTPLA